MDFVNEKTAQNDELQTRLKSGLKKLTELERECETSKANNRLIEQTFERQTTELTRLRQESAQLQVGFWVFQKNMYKLMFQDCMI